MQKSKEHDIKKLNSIIRSLANLKKAFELNDITSPKNLLTDELTQLACVQIITNIHEAKDGAAGLRPETRDRLINLNKLKLANHDCDYDSLNIGVIFETCVRLTKSSVMSEVYAALAELENADGE